MEQKKFDELVITLKEAMQAGDIEAAIRLGNLYYNGPDGNAKNAREALPYWKYAVDNGNMAVANKVAYCYKAGVGCVKNQREGFRYFKMNADHGNKDAQYEVGECYEEGIGCEKNLALARHYYEKAALQGHGKAQSAFAMMLYAEKHDDWLHWICCAHISGIQEATDYLNYMIKKDFPKDLIEWQIARIKEFGVDPKKHPSKDSSTKSNGGCYVATCVYGSYDCPQVWTLRRFRDNILASTWYGRIFIRIYYVVSPNMVKWFGHTVWFKKMWRGKLDQFVSKLQSEGISATPYEDKIW